MAAGIWDGHRAAWLGALWGARDPSGTIYVYAEHQRAHAERSENARALRRCGEWIPGILSTASLPGSQNSRNGIAEIYREQGLTIYAVQHKAEEAAMFELWQLLATKRIRIFSSLTGFLTAYRVYRVGDDDAVLLRSCEALISGCDYMRTRPQPHAPEYWLLGSPLDRNAWMA